MAKLESLKTVIYRVTNGIYKEWSLHSRWRSMLARCYNTSHDGYERYGGRGITVCPEWHKFEAFMKWALSTGYKEELTLERKDNHASYTPDNCEWVTRKQQAHNRRDNVAISAFGEQKLLCEWRQDPRCIVKGGALNRRLALGLPAEAALSVQGRQGKALTNNDYRQFNKGNPDIHLYTPSQKGEANSQAKLSMKQISEIRQLAGTLRQREIAERFGIAQSTVSMIIRGKSWPQLRKSSN